MTYVKVLKFRKKELEKVALATVLRLSSVVCTECIVAKRCVLEQKSLLTACRKSYMRNRLVPK